MRIFFSSDLSEKLGSDATQQLKQQFCDWKQGGEHDHLIFGKDSEFRDPKSAREEALRHVHLIPVLDSFQLGFWLKAHDHGSRKTSDRILVYVPGFFDPQAYLLMDILPEPDGHALMRDSVLLEDLAKMARRFREKI